MAQGDFSTVDKVFSMFQPADLVGTVQPDLGGPLTRVDNAFSELLRMLENDGRGVLTIDNVVARIQELKTKGNDQGNVDLSKFLTVWTDAGVPDLGPSTAAAQLAMGPKGEQLTVSSLKEVLGKGFQFPTGGSARPPKVSIVLSRSPFFSPMTRNTKRAEVFLNSMPSVVLSQMVPLMQVEFQFKRDSSDHLQSPGLLRFLVGGTKKDASGPNAVLAQARQMGDTQAAGAAEVDSMGMEAFTSPQTLVNPLPNQSVGTDGVRYTEVLDPFRPFLTLDHVTITSKPSGAGFVCYKQANMALKLHDRSRLAEIADLIRVNIYRGVTVWMTYGWRAPVRAGVNPYFDYVNNNLLVREPYHIKNSSFSFDANGTVTISLELFTKGMAEVRELKITDQYGDMGFLVGEVKQLIEQVSRYRRILRLDSPVGLSKEIRAHQILDAAEVGEFPNLKPDEIQKNIASLRKALTSQKDVDKDALNGLVTALQQLYKADGNTSKFAFKERYEKTTTKTVADMFEEVRTGPDPFLPTQGKGLGQEVTQVCDSMNKGGKQKRVVSFGKVFSVFALRAMSSLPDVFDEVQVFFYNLNDQAGPLSGHCVAEFPIKVDDFVSQFTDMVKEKGGEKVKLEDFMALVIDAQFTDPRAVGYGFSDFYQPWKRGSEPELKKGPDSEAQFESRNSAYAKRYGPFRQPQIEMYVEMSHERVPAAGDSDIMQLLSYSAADSSMVTIKDAQGMATRRIMRFHVYDKQTTPYKAAAQLLRNEDNTGFIEVNQNIDDYARTFKHSPSSTLDAVTAATKAQFREDVATGRIKVTQSTPFGTNQQVKDVISKVVPTIRFGANGTTVTSVNLTSKANPLVGTRNLLNSQAARNTAQPNGSGETGIPLRVIPAQLTMTSRGCPLATMAQQYFIDFQTGTTLDNLYILTHLSHNFSPGKFETSWTFAYSDGYGVFEGAPNVIQQLALISSNLDATT